MGEIMSDEQDIRRLDTSGYVRDPRLTRAAAAPPPARQFTSRQLPAAAAETDDDPYQDVRVEVAAAAPAPAPAAEPGVVELSKPYMAHGKSFSRIKLRRPVTRDIRKGGTPFKLVLEDDEATVKDVEYRWDSIANYIGMLADPLLPPSTVDEFEFEDLARCAGVIVGFFLGARTASPRQ